MDTRDLVWDIFCKTGNINDYLFYKGLSGSVEEINESDKNQGTGTEEHSRFFVFPYKS